MDKIQILIELFCFRYVFGNSVIVSHFRLFSCSSSSVLRSVLMQLFYHAGLTFSRVFMGSPFLWSTSGAAPVQNPTGEDHSLLNRWEQCGLVPQQLTARSFG